ncbi:hypothetical protein ROHU_012476 [Labeo rohita]|uniref:Uncharacterized protein n=1 Tax=Labeo rohita TaxID=84645 RepID=A0A498LKP0_LABRO|nr:hypothetical protein ROHU_012476 [Labeo rohita]
MDRARYWQQKYYYLVSASTSQSAADAAMGDKLKRDLQNLQRQKAPVTSTPMSEFPGIVSSLKDVLESMKRGPYSSRSSSSELSLAESSEMTL